MRKIASVAFTILGLSLSLKAQVNTETTEKRKLVIQSVATAVMNSHFEPKQLNDALSNDIFNLFIQRLDYNKKFFLASDIATFKTKYANKLDDAIISPDLNAYNEIVKIYQSRIAEVKTFYPTLLETPFSFKEDEEIIIDGKKLQFAKSEEQRKDLWRKELKYQVLVKFKELKDEQQQKLDKKDSTYDSIKTDAQLEIEARTKIQKSTKDYFERIAKINESDLFTSYVNCITGVMDPHTNFFPPKDKETFDIRMSGKLEGIGATLQVKDDYIKVASLVIGGPAWKEGHLKAEDLIMKVAEGLEADWFSLENVDIDEAIKHIRGKKGTLVRLFVKHSDGAKEEIRITRDVVEIEETFAKSSILQLNGKKIGYIYLPEFYADFNSANGRRCGPDMAKEVEKLKKDHVDAIIIDVRNNGGGSLSDVVHIAGLFVQSGPMVQVKARGQDPEILADPDGRIQYDGPVAVMVNEFSASASEILAAAIQDYHRGIVVGSPYTHGKGSVQRFYDLGVFARTNNFELARTLGALKITDQKFYRVNGGSTQLKGVTPDIILPDAYAKIEYGEKKDDFPLRWSQIPAAAHQEWSKAPKLDELQKKSDIRLGSDSFFVNVTSLANYIGVKNHDNKYSLNYDKYISEENEMKSKTKTNERLSKKTRPMYVAIPSTDSIGMITDTNKVSKNNVWRKNIRQDSYIYETGLILIDQILFDDKKR